MLIGITLSYIPYTYHIRIIIMLVMRDSNPVLFLFYTERTPGDATPSFWRVELCHACADVLPVACTL